MSIDRGSRPSIEVRQGDRAQAWAVYAGTPEFSSGEISRSEFDARLNRPDALVLVGHADGRAVAFKAGYDRYGDGSLYSWLGAVLPCARGAGLGELLIEAQERHARQAGYDRILVKTRNRFVGMRILLARCGYQVMGFETAEPLSEARLIHVKNLTPAAG